MRQADSTIKGYLYQFNKSIYEILQSKDDEIVTLEGVIEDIDIQSPTSLCLSIKKSCKRAPKK